MVAGWLGMPLHSRPEHVRYQLCTLDDNCRVPVLGEPEGSTQHGLGVMRRGQRS